jgi:hypothetical protein
MNDWKIGFVRFDKNGVFGLVLTTVHAETFVEG